MAVKPDGGGLILGDTTAVRIHRAEEGHGSGIAQIRRLAVKPHGFDPILGDAFAVTIHFAEIIHGSSGAQIRCPTVGLRGFAIAFCDVEDTPELKDQPPRFSRLPGLKALPSVTLFRQRSR
jgi:hypothetical protein